MLTTMSSLCMRTSMNFSSRGILALVTWTTMIWDEMNHLEADGDHEGGGWDQLSIGTGWKILHQSKTFWRRCRCRSRTFWRRCSGRKSTTWLRILATKVEPSKELVDEILPQTQNLNPHFLILTSPFPKREPSFKIRLGVPSSRTLIRHAVVMTHSSCLLLAQY